MNFIGRTEDSEIQVELKYCERCGGLWLRPQGADGVYCDSCRVRLAAMRNPRRQRPAKRAAAKRARKERRFKEKTFRARPGLNICRAWPRWRCGHDKRTSD